MNVSSHIAVLIIAFACFCPVTVFGNIDGVGIVGTGVMGTALGSCLIKQGRKVVGWNRSPSNTKELADAGATIVSNLHDLFSAVDVVIMAVVADDDMAIANGILAGVPEEVMKGVIFIQWTAHHPDAARIQASMVQTKGGVWLGGAMAGGAVEMCNGIGLYLAGPRDAYERVEPLMNLLGKPHYFGKDPGLGALYDMAASYVWLFGTAGLWWGMAILREYGEPLDAFLDLANKQAHAISITSPIFHEAASTGDYASEGRTFQPFKSFLAALRMHKAYFRRRGIDSSLVDSLVKPWTAAIERDKGYGDLGPSFIVQELLHQAQQRVKVETSSGSHKEL